MVLCPGHPAAVPTTLGRQLQRCRNSGNRTWRSQILAQDPVHRSETESFLSNHDGSMDRGSL
ncbi:hypothetical protein NW868_10360, partial [Synechococcus sp. R60.2]